MITAFGEILFDVYPDQARLGGAPFNFIYHVHRLTGKGSFISRIGNDEYGNEITKFLKSDSMGMSFVQIDDTHPTGTAIVRLDEGGIPTFTITEDVAYDHIIGDEKVNNAIGGSDLLYFGTLAQRSPVSRATLYQYCSAAPRCFVDVNLRQRYYSKEIVHQSFEYADFVKLNAEELETIHSMFFTGTFERNRAVRLLMRKYSFSYLALTLGSDGSWMFSADEEYYHKTDAPRVVDTVGAGDGFAAMMCVGIQNGWTIDRINTTASEFSASLCEIEGALPNHDSFYDAYREVLNNG